MGERLPGVCEVEDAINNRLNACDVNRSSYIYERLAAAHSGMH